MTTVLLVHGRKASARHFEHLVIISALKTLVDDAGGAFLEAEKHLEADEAHYQADQSAVAP